MTEVRDGLPPNLGRIIVRCLAKDPGKRYQTADEIHREMKGLQRGLAQVTPDSNRSNWPVHATPFIGRRHELAVLTDLVRRDDVHLVTLTGPGGVGKTRLSLQVAADVLDSFEAGAFFVELAPLSTTDAIVTAIAEAVGFQFGREKDQWEQLLGYLQKNRMLLVLDNFEQLLTSGRHSVDVLTNILEESPNIVFLVTSRQPSDLPAFVRETMKKLSR